MAETEPVLDMTEGWNSLAAELLYAYMDGDVPEEELAFYERRIRENGGLALDQACGTGRHIFPLLARGLGVHGADISVDALNLARQEAAARGVEVTLYHQRMEACDLPHHYGTIYVANGTFQILADRNQAIATLERFREHLTLGGQVLLELMGPPELPHGPAEHDAAHPIVWEPKARRGAPGAIATTLWSESVDLLKQTLLSKRRYDLIIDGAVVRSETHAHILRWFHHYEIILMLERAGFDGITTYADYTDAPATQDTHTILYGARRSLRR